MPLRVDMGVSGVPQDAPFEARNHGSRSTTSYLSGNLMPTLCMVIITASNGRVMLLE